MKEIEKGVGFYRERLGLYFDKLEDESLKFTLIYIHPQHKMRPYSFSLKVEESTNQYSLTYCNPQVHYESLLHQLNKDNELKPFIKGMRKLFVETVTN